MIIASDLSVKLGRDLILNDITVEIPHGHWTCLVGPNGAGKTTLLKTLLGVREYSGSLQDNGVEVFKNHKRNVAFVPQHPEIPTGMSVAEYVALGRAKIDGWGRESQASQKFIEEILIQTQLFGMHKQFVAHLSGGEMQRALIARALAQEPEIILLDEPTSALDPTLVGEVLKVMADLAHEGRTMIVVTHEMDFAHEAADRVYYMDKGEFAEVGPPEQVIDAPKDPRTKEFLSRFRTLGSKK